MVFIRVISDLHHVFYQKGVLWATIAKNMLVRPHDPEEILVLAGDIGHPTCENSYLNDEFRSLLQNFKLYWKHIVMVPGNHEYYTSNYLNTMGHIEVVMKEICTSEGIHYLQKDSVTINNIRFVGCTLWSQITDNDFMRMNDKYVFNGNPQAYRDMFMDHYTWLVGELASSTLPTVVVTHHLPTLKLLHPRFGTTLSSGFATNLDDVVIAYNDRIKLWCCGHTHEKVTAEINNIPIVANPVGYPSERRVTPIDWDCTYTIS